MNYDILVKLNEKNKNNIKLRTKNTDERFTDYSCTFKKEKGKLYIVRNCRFAFTYFDVHDIDSIVSFINEGIYYITNMSFIKKYYKYIDIVIVNDEVSKSIKDYISEMYVNSKIKKLLEIKRIKDLDKWISKAIIFGYTIKYNYKDIIYILEKENNTYIVSEQVLKIYNWSNFFISNTPYEIIKISNLDVSEITSFQGFFSHNICVEYIYLTNFETKNANNLSMMFYNCYKLKNIDLSNFVTTYVKDYSYMFCGCKSIEDLKLNNFVVYAAVDLDCMFLDCNNLHNLEINNWVFYNLFRANNIFENCFCLKDTKLLKPFLEISSVRKVAMDYWIKNTQFYR